MRRLRAIHVLTVFALALPAGLVTVGATSASAVALPTCASVTGANGLRWALASCTDAAHTGTKGTAVSTIGTNGTGITKITWNKTGTTTISFTYALVSPSKCPVPQGEIRETGKVTGGTGAAIKSMKKGQKTSVTLCQGANGVTVLKGTKFSL